MIDYPDTSFLCALFRRQDNSERALKYRAQMTETLHVTTLLEFEFLQSVRLQVWLHAHDRKKGYSQREADQMRFAWDVDRAEGIISITSYDAEAVTLLAGSLSHSHTANGGHRTLDVLHIATAVHLGAKRFLTFDTRQKVLARHAGLKTPL
jgi:predicted nucleic acid-binding protein